MLRSLLQSGYKGGGFFARVDACQCTPPSPYITRNFELAFAIYQDYLQHCAKSRLGRSRDSRPQTRF